MALSERRSDRVSLTLLLEVGGTDRNGNEFKERSRTLLINRNGAVILLNRELNPEQEIQLQRQAPSESHRKGRARVVGEFGHDKEGFLYGIEILDAGTDLWGIEFPIIGDSPEAVARMLLECSYCQSREVAYLNELELRGFEANRGIARLCKTCNVPSIWVQASHENEKKLAARAARKRSHDAGRGAATEDEQRARQRTRLKTRLTACIRQTEADDELAVCDDISPIGMCFRSKRRFKADAPVHIAVPYSPDAANIFLPARIVCSEEIPKAGLFRHGTVYERVGPQPQ